MPCPVATYRIQFTPGFDFAAAAGILDYLRELGISDIYASPIFRARSGSEHGYDVISHREFNPELGGEEGLLRLVEAAQARGMGWLQDIVPNHMAFTGENPALADVLENGPASASHGLFDIDWNHYYEGIQGKVLAPFLGSFFGRALENGELVLELSEQGIAVRYYGQRYPLRLESYLEILGGCVPEVAKRLGEEDSDYLQMLGLLYVLQTLRLDAPPREREAQARFIRRTLWTLYRGNGAIRRAVDRRLRRFNGRRGRPASFNALERLLGEQWFRLSFWKVATEEINYRRFFSINDLISLRMEDPSVFDAVHDLVLEWVAAGRFTGLRVDHIDGLYDPGGYLERLRARAPGTWLLVEKILGEKEALPPWPVEGTTGYAFLNQLNGLFVRSDRESSLTRVYQGFARPGEAYPEMVVARKRLIIERHMFGDINNLAHLLKNIASRHRYGSDITMDSLKRALIELMSRFPVYRTYLGGDDGRPEDRRYVDQALAAAREHNPGLGNEFEFIESILLLEFDSYAGEEERAHWRHFVRRFQQYTGPLMAKGFEDTLLYVYNRLLSLNEVGGEPSRFGLSAEAFHGYCRQRLETWPRALSATATHDTKRGEDARARLNVLSEIPQEWGRRIRAWSRLNASQRRPVGRRRAPDRNDEYLFYQTLLGALPPSGEIDADFLERLRGHLVKAVREAKRHTAWLKPDSAYEEAFLAFAEGALHPETGSAFLQDFLPFHRRIAFFGMLNSLSQTLIKITAPGVPDFYQGTEYWDLSLVDPDNRRSVDYRLRSGTLSTLRRRFAKEPETLLGDLTAEWADGRIKQFLTWRALGVRRELAELFCSGGYRPVEVRGPQREHLFAFARVRDGEEAVTVVPRFATELTEAGEIPLGEAAWEETDIRVGEAGEGGWREALSGRELGGEAALAAADILRTFPVALLVRGIRNREAG